MVDILGDLLGMGIIIWFVFFIVSKLRNKTMKETFDDIKGLFGYEEEEDV